MTQDNDLTGPGSGAFNRKAVPGAGIFPIDVNIASELFLKTR